MPSYATVSHMLEIVPAVGSVTSITSATMARFIDDAEAVINAKISQQYTVPVSPSVPLLETVACDIALYRLLTLRVYTQEQANKSPWPDRFKESMAVLDKIADGSFPLITSSGTEIATRSDAPGEVWSNTEGYKPTFTEDLIELNVIDDLKIDDVRADRGQ